MTDIEDYQALAEQACISIDNQQVPAAIEILKPLVTEEGPLREDYSACINYGIALDRNQQPAEAAKFMKPLVEEGFLKDDASANVNYVTFLGNSHQFTRALAHLENRMKEGDILEFSPAAYVTRGIILFQAGWRGDAAESMRPHVEGNGFLRNDKAAQTSYLGFLLADKQYVQAGKHSQELFLNNPNFSKDPDIHVLFVVSLRGNGQSGDALRHIEREMVEGGSFCGNANVLSLYRDIAEENLRKNMRRSVRRCFGMG